MPELIINLISKESGVDIKAAEKLRKSAWKKLMKQKIKEKIQKDCGMKWDKKQNQEQLKNDKLKSKICIEQCKGDIVKIRLCMCDLKKNYHNEKEEKQPLCPSCEIEDDTTEHVLKCRRNTNRKQRNIKNNNTEKE